MEGLWQLSGFHDDLRIEVQKRDTRPRKGAFYPNPDVAVELQLSVLHQLSDFPTGDDAHAEDAVGAAFEQVAVLRLKSIRLSDPPDPKWVSSRITEERPSPRWQ